MVVDTDLLGAPDPAQQLWLDGLYIRYRRTARTESFDAFIGSRAELWMTAVTIQGDSDGVPDRTTCGLWSAGPVYVEGLLLLPHLCMRGFSRWAHTDRLACTVSTGCALCPQL
jgi:hypothetical protein